MATCHCHAVGTHAGACPGRKVSGGPASRPVDVIGVIGRPIEQASFFSRGLWCRRGASTAAARTLTAQYTANGSTQGGT